jgi:RNA polymerase sigma-70 factor (ECF subfamily)
MPLADSPPNDTDLIAAARAGDADALDRLVTRYEPQVYRVSLNLCGNPDDASDVAQDTLLTLARSIDSFRGDSTLSTWLYTIARRACVKKRQRRARTVSRQESLDAMDPIRAEALAPERRTPEHALEEREIDRAVADAIATLPPAQREVLVLRDIEGLPASEAAAVLGLGVAAVKSRLHRARTALREQLAPLWTPAAAGDVRPKGGCRAMLAMFSRQLDGDLDAQACRDLEAHLAGCGPCRGACEALAQVLAVCRRTPAPALPHALRQSIHEAVRRIRRGRKDA